MGPEDLLLYRQLMAMFGEAFEDFENYHNAPPPDDYVQNLLSKEHFMAITAENDGQVVGGLAAYELQKFEQARSEIYIYDIAVAERMRRQGIATKLIEKLQAVAADRGAWVIFVQADHGDEPPINLYSKLGHREDVLHFDIAPKPHADVKRDVS